MSDGITVGTTYCMRDRTIRAEPTLSIWKFIFGD